MSFAASLHLEAAQALVGLQPLPLVPERLARRFGRPRQEAAAHHCRGAERQRHGDVAAVLHAPVSDDRHAVLRRELRDVVHGARLRTADGADLGGGVQGAGAHADTEAVGAGVEQRLGLTGRYDIAADHVHVGVVVLHPSQELHLRRGVALGGVEHNGVGAGLDELPHALLLRHPWRDGRGDEQLLVGVLRRQRVRCGPLQVLTADHRHQLVAVVEDGELPDLFLPQLVHRLRQRDGLPRDPHFLPRRHNLLEPCLPVRHQVHIATRHDALQLTADDAALRDEDRSDAVLLPDAVVVLDGAHR
mmetsp:Transcript_114380/g.330453  ORF Transcript_114380/g.330453 Transcript_114380/m.330453 type:complete len:303 (+) Transcript_114380:318-1226(+)